MFPSPNFDTPFDSLLKIMSSSSSSSSPQNPNPPLLFNFPSPFLDEHESPLNQIFLQNHHLLSHHHDQPQPPIAPRPNPGKSKVEEATEQNPTAAPVAQPRRRRAGKKDRHSKICTAQGIRDRRMRLSLQVARKFFDLQDMLGYDKASKTIEWLFTQSKSAIKELIDDLHSSPPPPPNAVISNSDVKSESFLSECEDVSGIEEINSAQNAAETTAKPYSSKRESREKARARARCRTREKMMVKRLRYSEDHDSFKPNPNSDQALPFCEGEGIRVSSYPSSLEQQLSDVGMIEKFLGNTTSSASDNQCTASASDYGSEFLGNWDVLSSERTNCFQLSFAGNLNTVFSAASPQFP